MAFKTGVVVVSGAVVLAFGCLGCDGVDGEDEGAGFGEEEAVRTRSAHENGWNLNGWNLNGWNLNGSRLNNTKLYRDGSQTDYIQLYDIWLPDGDYVNTGSLVGGMLNVGGYTDWEVEDTTFDFKVKEGATTYWKYVWLKFAYPVAGFSDVWEYDMDLQVSLHNDPLCIDQAGKRTRALLLNDVWDPATGAKVSPRPDKAITFACKDGGLAKCVLFGYRPWASKNGTSLADYHQACTRMLRADYCGDGQSHTLLGTPIHVLDQIGIQNVDPNKPYVVEAEWGPNGAVCLNPSNSRLPLPALGCSIPTCGAPFASGGLIQSGKIVP
ncbi:ADYC domain-containing protein [Nannocystis bainbridge]|uniref:ADYC domain-containing protein n=1 Tax=Nannocystis bainbridge TaxID=2995303 RepID=A0ABT5EC06_9BACT|nr:ADYC domain-containing protein [Nannocystis bainbridge]MDC0722326.1 ADYC domain-containing protein [Nannocystis bainbridge]